MFLLIAMALLPMLLLMGWIYYQRYKVRLEVALQTETEVAQGISATFVTYVEGVRRYLNTIGAGVAALSPYSDEAAVRLIVSEAGQYPGITGLSWVPSGPYLSSEPTFQRLLAGAAWALGDLRTGEEGTDGPVMDLAAAVRNPEGALLGVIVAAIDPILLGQVAIARRRHGDGVYSLFDRQGVLVYRSSGDRYVWQQRAEWREGDRVLQEALQSGEARAGRARLPGTGREWLAARVPIAGLGWIAGAAHPLDSAMAPVRRNLIQDILLAVLAFTLAVLLAWQVSRTISEPLRLLEAESRVMGGRGEGRMESRMEADPGWRRWEPAEVASLRGTVSRMAGDLLQRAQQLRERETYLRQLNDTLEIRVQERTAALESAVRELEAFSYSVSHDLRAPLRGIDGFSRILLEKYAGRLDERGSDYLARIRAAAQRMGRLIDELLNLSRIGRKQLHCEPVDLSAMAESIVGELRVQEPLRKVDTKIAPGLRVYGDPELVRIVLTNLLGNAWKFTSRRDEARIEVGCREVDGQRLCFVRDNGAGFDMSQSDKLFTPFQRLHTEAEFPGSGIGLAIVQRIVSRHGGQVCAEGAEGAGATVFFTFQTERSTERS